MAVRIENYRIITAPDSVRDAIEYDMDHWVHACFMRKESVIENFFEKWGDTPGIEIEFEDDFGIGTFST